MRKIKRVVFSAALLLMLIYIGLVIENSKAMAEVFLANPNFKVITGGTDNHLFLVDVTKVVENGKVAQHLLDEVNITLNKNSIPYEKLSPFKTSGIRIGSAAITARGFGVEEARKVAQLTIKALENAENDAVLEEVRQEVRASRGWQAEEEGPQGVDLLARRA